MMDLCLLILASVMAVNGNSTSLTNTTSTTPSLTNTTSTTPLLTNTTSKSLKCQNNGRETNGFCLCPNNYTGNFCELSNLCLELHVNGFTFPMTVIGQASYSRERCAQGTLNAGFPRATARCLNNTFASPQKLNCDQNLDTIDSDLSNVGNKNKLELASNTQILTSKPVKLTTQNISAAVNIVNRLLSKSTEDNQDVNVAVVTTVSQLLTASREQFDHITTESTAKLTQTLQEFSLTQVKEGSSLVQPNIAIQSMQVTQSSKIQMTVFSALNNGNQPNVPSGVPSSDTFSANMIKIIDNSVSPGDQFPIDVQMEVKLKEAVKADIGFVLYNNDRFFRSQVFQPSLNMNRRVITASLTKKNVLDFVNFTMKNQKVSSVSLHDFACVIWDDKEQGWSTKGCEKNGSPAHQSCKCKGTETFGNYAMLMSYRTNPEIAMPLGMISIIGCALSVMCLTITIMFQILTRKSRRSSPTVLMVSICVCMTIVYLLFIFGINNPTLSSGAAISQENIIPQSDFHQDPDFGPCTVVTVLLHYFLLAAFTWSILYSLHIFLLFKNTISGPPQYFSVLSIVVGWGLPAVVVGITLGITYRMDNPLNYRQEALCWLAVLDQNNNFDGMKPMLWSFLIPVAVMLLFNIAVFFYFSYATCRTNPDLSSSQITPLRNKMLSCVSMAVVLGLSWIIGYIMLLETKPIMYTILSFAFCLCNSTQGIQIFVLFTLRTPIFKDKVLGLFKLISIPVLARHRESFDVWVIKEADHEESYRSVDFDRDNL